jgi:hypothetical protein
VSKRRREPEPFRGCVKKPYASPAAAYGALLRQTMSAATPVRAYRCPLCAPAVVYHLTSQPKRTRPGPAGQHLGGDAA